MRTLGLPWRDALLIVVVAAGLAASIATFAATAPGLRRSAHAAPTNDEATRCDLESQIERSDPRDALSRADCEHTRAAGFRSPHEDGLQFGGRER